MKKEQSVAAGKIERVLEPSWYAGDTCAVAVSLLGKYVVIRREDNSKEAHLITEVEAYSGKDDRASHASRGRTKRTEVMFGPPGVWYVYLCYGMHFMLNIVSGPEDFPAAVLLRGLEGIRGPGRITRALGIDKRFNGLTATKRNGLWIEDRGVVVPRSRILKTSRIGVAYAGEVWAGKPWRFVLLPPL